MTTETRAMVAQQNDSAAVLERVIVAGDLARLTPAERIAYYRAVCESIGLNPLTQPFAYITLNGKLTLYASKTATDQLRTLRGISIDDAQRDIVDPDYATWLVTGHDATGRTDMEIGSVSIAGLKGEARSNAIMKALTKGKRRLTLSLAGLGWLDETEVGSVPSAEAVDVDQETGEIRRRPTLRESIAERKTVITSGAATTAPLREGSEGGEESPPSPSTPAGGRADTAPTDSVIPMPAPVCGAIPDPEGPLGMTEPCTLSGIHKMHRSAEGSWPAR